MILSANANRLLRRRQLPALAVCMILALALAPVSAQTLSSPSSAGELRAAKLMEVNLEARSASAAEWRKLEKAYADMDTKYPKNVAVKNAWAQYLWDRGEKQAAVEKWMAVIAIEPRNDLALSNLGEASLELGDVKKAAAFYTRASDSAPRNAAYHFDLANVIFLFRFDILDAEAPDAEAMIRRARGHFAEAARLEPLNVEYAKAYADIFYDLKPADWEAALTAWNHFLEISPQKDFGYANLARVHMKLGQKTEARACLAQIHAPDFNRLKARLNERMETE